VLAAALLILLAPWCPPDSSWAGGRYHGTDSREAQRREHRERYHYALGSLGLDREAGQVADAIAWGESRYDSCAVHTLGKNEHGRGLIGSSVGLHLRDKWGAGPEQVLHIPEVAAVVMARTMRRKRRGTWLDVHRGHAGVRGDWVVARFCERLRARGVDCKARVSRVGTRLGKAPTAGQWPWLVWALIKAVIR